MVTGYYRNPPIDDLPGKRLGEPYLTIMNPDSYAYLATLWRLQDKKWVSKLVLAGNVTTIKLEKNEKLELVGDWPGAPEDDGMTPNSL